jgi:RNA polymerase sigma factor (sigma-70 family)
MATEQLNCVLRHVRRLIGRRGNEDLTDAELLARFVVYGDEAAFEVIVRRHGPLVLRVCRRVLGDDHDAEDAFQATFLVLARKAGAVRDRQSIAGWLYEVAYHLALRARRTVARRRQHERRAAEMPPREEFLSTDERELHAVLDEELRRLPEKYRTPLVLCYLEGMTNEQAARELGWAAGSMSYRLSQARELLRKRMNGRGLALPAAGLIALLTEEMVSAAVPTTLVHATVRAAACFAAGKTVAAGMVSANAVALAEGALTTMLTTKMKLAAALLLTVGLLGSGVRMFVQADDAAPPAPAAKPAEAKAEEKPAATDTVGDPLPPGAVSRLGNLRWQHGTAVRFLAYLGDGKEVLTASQDGALRVWDAATGKLMRKFGKVGNAGGNGGVMVFPAQAGAMMMPAMNVLSAVALSPDQKTLVIGSQDGTMTLWDVAEGKEVRSFKANPQMAPTQLTWTPDGKSLFMNSYDPFVRQFDVSDGKEIRKFGEQPKGQVQVRIFGWGVGSNGGLAVTPDGKTLLVNRLDFANNQQSIQLHSYEISSGKEASVLKGPQLQAGISSVVISPDAKLIAWGHYTGVVHVWDIAAGKEVQKLTGPQNMGAAAMTFTTDGKRLAVRNNDQAIRLWDVADGEQLRLFGDPIALGRGFNGGFIQSNIALSADGSLLASATGANTVRQWDVKTGKEVAVKSSHHGSVAAVALSPDGKTAMTRSTDNVLHLWDADKGIETKSQSLAGNVSQAAFSADGKLLALGGFDGTVHIWDALNAKEMKEWKAGNQGFASLALTPNGKTLAVRGFDQSIRLFDVATGNELRQVVAAPPAANPGGGFAIVAYTGNAGSTQTLTFSPDGTLLAGLAVDAPAGAVNAVPRAPTTSSLRLWDVATGKVMRKFEAPKTAVLALAFSPDGRTIATANADNTISLWEAASGKERSKITVKVAALPKPAEDAQTAELRKAAQALVQLQSGARVGGGGNAVLSCLSYSPDGKQLAAGGADGQVRFFDAATGKETSVLKGHQAGVITVAFAADGKRLATGSTDTTALVWQVPAVTEDKPATLQVEKQQLEDLWNDLVGADAAKAHLAIRTLTQLPKQAVPLLQEHLQPVPAPDAEKVAQLIADLDSPTFATRKKAEDELEKLGELADDAMKKALDAKPALEVQKRLEGLREKLVTGAAPPPQTLRVLRALEVLESIGTPEAKQVLQTIAKGAAGASVTKDAQATLDRLGKR